MREGKLISISPEGTKGKTTQPSSHHPANTYSMAGTILYLSLAVVCHPAYSPVYNNSTTQHG